MLDRWSRINSSSTEARCGVCKILKNAGVNAPFRWTRADSHCEHALMNKEATSETVFRQINETPGSTGG